MAERGAIRNEEAYALGKMLDHSAWQRGIWTLPRGITPSDIDCAFDNDGRLLLCEFSTDHDQWEKLKFGQRLLYENAIKGGAHCAVLCRHSVRPDDGRQIDTRGDVSSFQIMIYGPEPLYLGPYSGAGKWDAFVQRWYADPMRQLRALHEKARSA